MKLADYLRMPWTVQRTNHSDDGEYIALHVLEFPGFVVAGRTDEEVENAFWEAFPLFLTSFIESGEEIPSPNLLNRRLPQLEFNAAYEVSYERPSDLISRYSDRQRGKPHSVAGTPTRHYPALVRG